MKVLSIVVLLILPLSVFAQKKQICFTVDDLPFVSYGMSDTLFQKETVAKLVQSFKQYDIPAIGFVNGNKLYTKSEVNHFQYGLLELWVQNGLELGNHTYSHPNYNQVSYTKYTNDIIKGEEPTKGLLKKYGQEMRYFRHPYLRTGNTKGKSDSLQLFLMNNGYLEAPVTVDNDDYLFALAYKRALDKNDTVLMTTIGSEYVAYMERKVQHFETKANDLFQSEIKQILLIHSSLLNADYVDDLAEMLIRNNYTFITLDEAMTDKAYETPITIYPKWGISWIDRWALSQDKPREFFKGEPDVPDFIKELSKSN